MTNIQSIIPKDIIIEFCQRWKIDEFSMFGSILREDFGSESDLDILVTFSPKANWGLLDHVKMQIELQEILKRNVDLVSKRGLEQSQNWLRREEILSTARVLYSKDEAIHASR